jgi:hypothetical protein
MAIYHRSLLDISQPSQVLPRPVESTEYTSNSFGKRRREAGVMPSMGFVGYAYVYAMAENLLATLERKLLNRRRLH